MKLSDLEHFRDILNDREEALRDWVACCTDVDEDETRKVNELLDEIRNALGRIENQSFGTCEVCQGTMELHRLEVQPVRQVCIECFSDDEKHQLEHELFLASKIHRALLPQNVERIDGFDIAVKSLAAHVVGGDYYDFLPSIDGGLVRVVIADSMGKGLPAGLVMSNLQGAMRILANDIESPAKLLSSLNRWMCRNIPVESFVSLACVGLRPLPNGSTEMIQANAGHCPSIVVRTDGSVELLAATGTFVGVHEDFTYTEETLILSPGDLLVLYTDGVTEAESPHDEMFGDERLIEFVRRRRDDSVKDIIESLTNEILVFSDRPDMADDFTVMALRKAT
jgi:sigma-B regulation protein RsbU (phosphoserine phosphatase)